MEGKRLVEDLESERGIFRGPLVLLCEFMYAVRHGQCAGIELHPGEEWPAGFVEDGVTGQDGHDPLADLPLSVPCSYIA